ncbi:MAG: TGS domain-containing protein [Candidatus Aenigmarchaeota archaeon]|nr:TGS domain-containing protein [Candidatus Aenigmarchaeota archaeon]
MPTNLPAEWYKKKEEFDNARGEEKIKKLEELIALTPYHKGTENLRADLRKKLAKLKRQLEAQKSQRRGRSYTITKEGDARVSIIGFPNSGKSTFLKKFTNADPEIAPYLFTTTKPELGMFEYEGVQIQFVEIPSTWTKEQLSIAKTSELVIFLLGESEDKERQKKELKSLAQKEKIKNYIFISTDEITKDELFEMIWQRLNMIRVYTKEPGKKPKERALVLKKGATIKDVCEHLHEDFLNFFAFAKVKGPSAKYNWEKVGLDHELKDDDVVEIHIRQK